MEYGVINHGHVMQTGNRL